MRLRNVILHSARLSVMFIMSALLLSCATSDGDAARLGAAPGAEASTARGAAFRPGGDHGLQVLHWTISAPVEHLAAAFDHAAGRQRVAAALQRQVAAALIRYGDDEALDEPARQRLERNGLRMIRIPREALETVRAELGGLTRDFDAWHGQALDWRALAEGPIADTGTALAVDGRVHRYVGGRIELMLRGWTLLMETGPKLYIELAPEYLRSRSRQVGQLIGRRSSQRDRFAALAVDLELEPGSAYILAPAAPGEQWTLEALDVNDAASSDDAESSSSGEDGSNGEADAESATDAGLGPAVSAPLTIGELLLCPEAGRPQRRLIVLVPRIPEALFPPQRAAVP